MPTALRGHARDVLIFPKTTPVDPRYFSCPRKAVGMAPNSKRKTVGVCGDMVTIIARVRGCHAHGFAWACRARTLREGFPRFPCPRKAVGMAPSMTIPLLLISIVLFLKHPES